MDRRMQNPRWNHGYLSCQTETWPFVRNQCAANLAQNMSWLVTNLQIQQPGDLQSQQPSGPLASDVLNFVR